MLLVFFYNNFSVAHHEFIHVGQTVGSASFLCWNSEAFGVCRWWESGETTGCCSMPVCLVTSCLQCSKCPTKFLCHSFLQIFCCATCESSWDSRLGSMIIVFYQYKKFNKIWQQVSQPLEDCHRCFRQWQDYWSKCVCVQKGSTSRVIRLGSYISFLLLAGIE